MRSLYRVAMVGSLFLRGCGTHLFVHRAEADPEAARHVLGLPPTRPRARAAFNPASVVKFQQRYQKSRRIFRNFLCSKNFRHFCGSENWLLFSRPILTPDTTYALGQEAQLVTTVVGQTGVVLVAWEHKAIARALLPAIANGQTLPGMPTKSGADEVGMTQFPTDFSGGGGLSDQNDNSILRFDPWTAIGQRGDEDQCINMPIRSSTTASCCEGNRWSSIAVCAADARPSRS
jgi:hypothetical protein